METKVENCLDGFSGKPLPAMIRIQYPADFGLATRSVSQPQRDITDRTPVVFHDDRQGATRRFEAGLCDPLGEILVRVLVRPRVVEQVSSDFGARIESRQPGLVFWLMQPELQSFSVQW